MRKQIMILDAYNILHRHPVWAPLLERSLEEARDALLAYCRRWTQSRGDVWLFIAVFDGDSGVVGGQRSAGQGVRVVYSATGESADDRILKILHEFGDDFDYVVVSDDREVMQRAKLLGADLMSASDFGSFLSTQRGRGGKGRKAKPLSDDALPPHEAKAITDSLRRLWGG
jgi:predicted RNA-binding protein with PIN domain